MEGTSLPPDKAGEGQPVPASDETQESPASAVELLARALHVDAPEAPAAPAPEPTPAQPDALDASQPGPDGTPVPKAVLDLLRSAGVDQPSAQPTPSDGLTEPSAGMFGGVSPDDVRQVPKAAVALRVELEYGRHESAMAYRALEELGPIGFMARAVSETRKRDLPAARRDRDAALEQAPNDARLHLIAGVLSGALREYGRALRELKRAAELAPGLTTRAWLFATDLCARMTWGPDLRACIEQGLAADPPRRRHYLATLVQLYEEIGMLDEALSTARQLYEASATVEHALPTEGAAARTEPKRDERLYALLRIVRIAAAAGRLDEAEEAVKSAVTRASPDRQPEVHVVAAEALAAAGQFQKAESLLQALLDLEPTAAVASGLGRLALARGNDSVADAFARRALTMDPEHEGALRTMGVCALRRGQTAEAITLLDRALALNPADTEARAWRAQAGFRQTTSAVVHDDWEKTGTFKLAAQVMLLAHQAFLGRLPRGLAAIADGTIGALLRWAARSPAAPKALPPARDQVSSGGQLAELIEQVCTDIRSAYRERISLARIGHLERVPLPSARDDARRALQTIRVLPPAEVHERIEKIIAKYPDSSLPLTYLGELYVWLGDTAKAREYLEKALQHTRKTRWAYIGLGACDLLEGNYEESYDMQQMGVEQMDGVIGPAVYVHRGEALRRLGRLDQARDDLKTAVEQGPDRVSGWINLGLLYAAQGDKTGLARCFHEVRMRAPGLVSDAADELKVEAWLAEDAVPSPGDQEKLLEHTLKMLRGNRSSDLATYFLADGRMRTSGRHVTGFADRDAQDIGACEALVDGYLRGGALELL